MIYFSQRISSEKSGDSFKRQEESWRRAYAVAGSLRERFPQIDQVVVDMVFEDVKKAGTYSTQMRSFSASAKAFFAFPCPRTLCLDGGYDLDPLIVELLAAGDTSAMGIMECRGALGATRSEDARCLLRMHYRIQIHYKVPVRRN
jgi:hypothetical protein